MDLEERTLDDNLARNCEVCGTALSDAEILRSRESGGPFLCTVHANEELPAIDDSPADEAGELGEAPTAES